MKRMSALFLLIVLIFSSSPQASATERENIVWHQESTLQNGMTIIDEVIYNSLTRSSTKDHTRRKTITNGDGVIIAVISVRGVFRYDGNTVSVVSKSVTQADTYEGWNYKQNSLTSSGGTIALDAKLTKLLVASIPVDMTLSCDKDGNISYT